MKFRVFYHCLTNEVVDVDAETKTEAVQKAKRGEVIEGTQDSDPGKMVWKDAYAQEVEKP